VTLPQALNFRVLKKWRPLDIPYDSSLLRTGDCLVRIGLGTVNGNKLTAHILPEKYPALKAACPGKGPPKAKHKIPENPKDTKKHWDDVHGKIKFVTPRCHAEHVPDLSWICPANLEKFNPNGWEIKKWCWLPTKEPTFSCQEFHIPEPKPLTGAEFYHEFHIPNIRKRTKAKTDKGLARFNARMETTWANRKAEFDRGKNCLRKERRRLLHDGKPNFDGHSQDGTPIDPRNSCPRCGCSFFKSTGRKNLDAKYAPATVHEKLKCYDCGYELREKYYRIKASDVNDDSFLGALHAVIEPPEAIPRLTPQEFVAALLIDGRLDDITGTEERRKILGSYLQLCEGWLPADVKNESGFDGEQESAIRQRATRLSRALLEHQQAKKPLPEPTKEEIAYLIENINVTEFVA
jgi:hypothetical protein